MYYNQKMKEIIHELPIENILEGIKENIIKEREGKYYCPCLGGDVKIIPKQLINNHG